MGFCVIGVLILLAGWAMENNPEYRRMRQAAEDVPAESVNKRPFWDGILYNGKEDQAWVVPKRQQRFFLAKQRCGINTPGRR